MSRALDGLTVLSLEQATVLPFLTYRLACDGARVLRIENAAHPDPNRFVGRDVLGEPAMRSYFLPNNCGKEAITLNLAEPEGRALLRELLRALRVDVFATNQRARSYARLGIDYPTLAAVAPGLIWLGVSGFGPAHDEAAYDPILQARAGFMELTGEPDGPPTVFGLPMVDLGAAEHGYGELLKALYRRARGGGGARIDVSMLRSAVSWMTAPLALGGSLGERVTRRGNTHRFFAPVSVFATRDGWVYVAVGNDAQWAALARLPALAGVDRPAYATNAGRIADTARLHREVGAAFRRLATDEALVLLREAGVPVARVATLADVVADPLVAPTLARVRDPRTGLEIVLPAPPAGDPPPLGFPPRLGEHNEKIYGGVLGYAPERLAELRARGII
ncbi:MAG: CMP-binding protein [Candidatus Rokubacteria bacterium RIFCSPLOWO2_12_FULL_71_22]|nr:MAG: CMP-binding protein [Candidatus Rokubacteria bacterium RIFCSPLOWO2_02_FULL_72_37]OGL15347.1 MAG: CMP-binding protein [Candidatus Rokubacteria bacterium RIFCSPLOWO2_12_FULL_71_22]